LAVIVGGIAASSIKAWILETSEARGPSTGEVKHGGLRDTDAVASVIAAIVKR
jgi:hypothetical protein